MDWTRAALIGRRHLARTLIGAAAGVLVVAGPAAAARPRTTPPPVLPAPTVVSADFDADVDVVALFGGEVDGTVVVELRNDTTVRLRAAVAEVTVAGTRSFTPAIDLGPGESGHVRVATTLPGGVGTSHTIEVTAGGAPVLVEHRTVPWLAIAAALGAAHLVVGLARDRLRLAVANSAARAASRGRVLPTPRRPADAIRRR